MAKKVEKPIEDGSAPKKRTVSKRKVAPKKTVAEPLHESQEKPEPEVKNNLETKKPGLISRFMKFLRTTHRGYLLSILLAIFALFIFVFYQYKVSSQRAKFLSDLHSLSEKNKKMMEEQNKNFLHQIATPFTWAVRSEMLRKNFEIVDQYMIKLVQKQNFQSVYIVDNNGKVLLASNKKNQGKKFSDFMPAEYLSYANVVVKKITDTKYYCSSPILGFESRIGTVFFEYTPKFIDLDKLYKGIEENKDNESKNSDLEEPEKELPLYKEKTTDTIH